MFASSPAAGGEDMSSKSSDVCLAPTSCVVAGVDEIEKESFGDAGDCVEVESAEMGEMEVGGILEAAGVAKQAFPAGWRMYVHDRRTLYANEAAKKW